MSKVITVNGKKYQHIVTCQNEEQVKAEIKALKIKSFVIGYAIYEEIKK